MASTASSAAKPPPTLPAKKRKASNASNTSNNSSSLDALASKLPELSQHKASFDSSGRKPSADSSAASRDPSRLPSKKRKGSHDSSSARARADSSVSFDAGALRVRKGSFDSDAMRVRQDSMDLWPRKFSDSTGNDELMQQTLQALTSDEGLDASTNALDHLEALDPMASSRSSTKQERKDSDADRSGSANSFGSSGQRMLIEAFMQPSSLDGSQNKTSFSAAPTAAAAPTASSSSMRARDRLESWGGMSDLSIPHHATDEAAAPPPAVDAMVPSRISLQRERLSSIASLSEVSVNLPMFFDYEGLGTATTVAEIQAYVSAAVASVGDQLAELAGAVESAANDTDTVDHLKKEADSETSSVASPLIGAMSDHRGRRPQRRPRSWSTSSGKISVDYDAIQQAVDAAQAATGSLDMATISKMASNVASAAYPAVVSSSNGASNSSLDKKPRARRKLPLSRPRGDSGSINSAGSDAKPSAALTEKEIEDIRERARAAAGYTGPPTAPPLKKRAKRTSPEPDRASSNSTVQQTPKVSNKKTKAPPSTVPKLPFVASSVSSSKVSAKGPANQKWELMFDYLLKFVDERREEETQGMSDQERSDWTWDGNVPTTYKTKDGKALGRWVNNQRSAKSKGTLKEEREDRLIDAGLKWSVLSSNSWNEMLQELRVYVEERTKHGKKWDGNVPTNYQIKTRPNSEFHGEDKNLGRWVNRQRSMYQSGRLREDRQRALEKLGLKWSMLATTSWDSMFDTLNEYVEIQKKDGAEWDGNVPANFKTNDDPPRALGRWVNRQRSAFVKKKLKQEYVDKLNEVGLKWSVHERGRSENGEDNGNDSDSDSSEKGDEEPATKEENENNDDSAKL